MTLASITARTTALLSTAACSISAPAGNCPAIDPLVDRVERLDPGFTNRG